MAKAAEGFKAGFRLLESKIKQREATGATRSQSYRVRLQTEEAFGALGKEVFRIANTDSTSVEINDSVRDLLSRLKSLNSEIDEIKKKVDKAESSADRPSKASEPDTAAESAPAQRPAEPVASSTDEPEGTGKIAKAGRAKRAQVQPENQPAEAAQKKAEPAGEEPLAEIEGAKSAAEGEGE